MNNEYVIINKKEMLKEIESLKDSLAVSESNQDKIRAGIETFEIKRLEWCLSRSTPLIPEIEKAYTAGMEFIGEDKGSPNEYISNLKLDI